jgi:hypothetical protein
LQNYQGHFLWIVLAFNQNVDLLGFCLALHKFLDQPLIIHDL